MLSCVQLFASPWTIARQALLSVGFFRLPFPPIGVLSPGIQPVSPALADRFFATESPGKPQKNISNALLDLSELPLPHV